MTADLDWQLLSLPHDDLRAFHARRVRFARYMRTARPYGWRAIAADALSAAALARDVIRSGGDPR